MVLSLRYLLPDDEFLANKGHLSQLLARATKRNRHLSVAELLEIMGLPSNWKRIIAYISVKSEVVTKSHRINEISKLWSALDG